MSVIATFQRIPGIFAKIERGDFLPACSYHLKGRKGHVLGISGESLIYPLKDSRNAAQLKRWLVQVEDKRFYRHGAIDQKGILRAILRNLKVGRISQGGSTITQQLARSLFLDSSRTWTRKLAETIIAFKLEKHLTKDQLLNAYCDTVYMGRGSRGFEAASRLVYRKSFANLEPEKIVGLIGLLGAPERFHPENNEKMFWLRAEQKALGLGIQTQKIPLNPIHVSRTRGKRLEHAVRSELTRLSVPQHDIKAIELTIDEGLQRLFDQELKQASLDKNIAQLAAVAICTKTGDVLAESAWTQGMPSEFSPGFSGLIQPGSTFKTFALLAAIESGIDTGTVFDSAPYFSSDGAGRLWKVRNYGDTYSGRLTLEDALIRSDNTVFARLTEHISPEALASIYERFRLASKRSFSRAAVLGGIREGLPLLRITNAYATIARDGVAIEPRLVRQVEYRNQPSIFISPSNETTVADRASIQKLKQVLVRSGIRSATHNLPGKTGTTTTGSLFTGYDENVSVGLWVNFRHEQPEHNPKALTAKQVMKRIGKKLLAWSEQRALGIF